MSDLIKGISSIVLIALLVVAVICFVPMVFLWCINSLSEAGGASFYIEHNLWNYFVALVMAALLNGSK